MSGCCYMEGGAVATPKTHTCPVNGHEYRAVPLKTILHHIDSPWGWPAKNQGYYFCDDPVCNVVYFGEDDSVIGKHELRTIVGRKECNPDVLVCYCFSVSRLDAEHDLCIRDFIVQKTSSGMCSCATSNPSGRCCLKDFPVTEDSSHS